MRIHPITRRIAQGLAGDGVGVDNVQIKPGGGANGYGEWWGDRIIYVGGGFLRSCLPDGSDDQDVLLNGAKVTSTYVRASLFGWVSFHWDDAQPTWNGVTCSWGFRDRRAMLIDMSKKDGSVLVGNGYQVEGLGISAYRAGAMTPQWTVRSAVPSVRIPYPQGAILDIDRACWTETVNGRIALKGHGLPPGPNLPWDVLHPMSLIEVDGAVWVGYLRGDDDTPMAHPWDYTGVGVFVQDPGPHYGPIAANVNGKVTLYWSIGPGERAGEIKSDSPPPVDLTATAVPVTPPDVSSMEVFGLWWAYRGMPGNAATSSPNGPPVPPHSVVFAVDRDIASVPSDRLGVLLVHLWPDDDVRAVLTAQAAIAKQYRVPLGIYFDAPLFPFTLIEQVCEDEGVSWIAMPQWFLKPGQDPDAFARDMVTQARAFNGHPFVATPRFFTSWRLTPDEETNGVSLEDAVGVHAVPADQVTLGLNALIRHGALRVTGYKGSLGFCGDRKDGVGGTKSGAALKPVFDAWAAVPTTAVNGRAFADQFYKTPEALAITVGDYTTGGEAPLSVSMAYNVTGTDEPVLVEMLIDGQVVAFSSSRSGAIMAAPLLQPGEYRLKARVTAGNRIAETGAERIVRVRPAPPKPEIPGITFPSQPGSGTVEGARKPSQEAADAAKREENK